MNFEASLTTSVGIGKSTDTSSPLSLLLSSSSREFGFERNRFYSGPFLQRVANIGGSSEEDRGMVENGMKIGKAVRRRRCINGVEENRH